MVLWLCQASPRGRQDLSAVRWIACVNVPEIPTLFLLEVSQPDVASQFIQQQKHLQPSAVNIFAGVEINQ